MFGEVPSTPTFTLGFGYDPCRPGMSGGGEASPGRYRAGGPVLPDVVEPAYAWCMTQTPAEVLHAAKALPREQRAEVVQELIATLRISDVTDESRLAALRDAVDAGIASLDADEGIRIPADGLRDYLRERGRLATERASAKTT